MMSAILPISLGAASGAVVRWLLSTRLNSLYPALPMGTLLANLLGGYLVGLAVSYFALHLDLSPQWRLLVITGFLGGLTTFSTFSVEVVTQVQQGALFWAFATIAAHVIGSLLMTFLGMATVAALS